MPQNTSKNVCTLEDFIIFHIISVALTHPSCPVKCAEQSMRTESRCTVKQALRHQLMNGLWHLNMNFIKLHISCGLFTWLRAYVWRRTRAFVMWTSKIVPVIVNNADTNSLVYSRPSAWCGPLCSLTVWPAEFHGSWLWQQFPLRRQFELTGIQHSDQTR